MHPLPAIVMLAISEIIFLMGALVLTRHGLRLPMVKKYLQQLSKMSWKIFRNSWKTKLREYA